MASFDSSSRVMELLNANDGFKPSRVIAFHARHSQPSHRETEKRSENAIPQALHVRGQANESVCGKPKEEAITDHTCVDSTACLLRSDDCRAREVVQSSLWCQIPHR